MMRSIDRFTYLPYIVKIDLQTATLLVVQAANLQRQIKRDIDKQNR